MAEPVAGADRATDTPVVVVAALTFRRPDDLAQLLPLLEAQTAQAGENTSILIVDNDPDASARQMVEQHPSGAVYLHAPTPGIAAARNAALTAAADADVLIFIDDDERPVPGWLTSMLAVWEETRATAVVGPVLSEFATPPEPWIVAGRYFDRLRHTTGSTVEVAATNNLLLDLGSIRRWGLRFDDRFGLTGGSDTLFTRSIVRNGGRMVWCDEAVVMDVVPAARATREWVTRRAFRSGNSWALTSLALSDSAIDRVRVRVTLVRRGVGRIGAGAAGVVAGAVLRRIDLRARGSRAISRGRGMVAGSLGRAYVEYRRVN